MKKLTKLIATITAGICLFGAATCTFGSSSLVANAADYEKKGKSGDYSYYVWNQSGSGTAEFENTENNGFTASWDGIFNLTLQKGISFPEDTVSAFQVNKYQIDYDADITTDGIAYVGVTGFFTKPTAEFYIVEAWGEWEPPGTDIADAKVGSAVIGGTTYDLYKHMKVVQIHDTTYPVYWSVAKRDPLELGSSNHIEGTIDVTAHFQAWAASGLDLGRLYEIMFNVDAYKSNGSVKLNSMDTRAEIESENVYDYFRAIVPYEEHDPLPMDKTGKFIKVDFESGADKFSTAGEENNAEITGDHSFNGSRSLHIPISDDTPAAVFYELDPYDLPATESTPSYYQAGARLLHNAGHDVKFTVDLIEYSDIPSVPSKVKNLGTRLCSPGQWMNINDILFDFDHNVYRKYRIVFTPAEPVDYCLDDFFLASGDPDYLFNIRHFDPDIQGDLNGDGVIDSLDIAVCRRAIMNSMGAKKIETAGDVNGDFRSNVSDLVILTKYVLGVSSELPLSDNEEILYIGDCSLYDEESSRKFTSLGSKYNDDSVRTVMRKDHSFTSEWRDTYCFKCYDVLDLSESFDKKTAKEYDISYSADLRCTGDMDVDIYGFLKNGYWTLDFHIYDGWSREYTVSEHNIMMNDTAKSSIITVNGTEYDMYIYSSGTSTLVYLYRRDNPVKGQEYCHIENSFNLGDFLKYWHEFEDSCDIVSHIGVNITADNSSGYADFKELSFTKE